MIGIDIGLFMSGIVVVESVFGWPGIGQLAWQAIQRVDIPIIMGVTLVSACSIVVGNLLADLVAPLIDPRIKLAADDNKNEQENGNRRMKRLCSTGAASALALMLAGGLPRRRRSTTPSRAAR